MDDKFLYQNRPPVRPGFSESLYARLSNMSSQSKVSNKVFKFALRLVLTGLLLFAVLFTFSEPVRASVLDWIRHIAGFEVQEVDLLYVVDPNAPSFVLRHNSLVYALKDLPFEFAIPAYAPDGYVLVDKIEFDDYSVFLNWVNQDKEKIWTTVQNTVDPAVFTGFDSAEEIQINGQPAMLIHGAYVDGKWDYTMKGITIYFKKDGLTYILGQFPSTPYIKDIDVSQNELIRVAESIPDLNNYDNGVYYYTPQPVEDILQNPPFIFNMPGYLPEGYLPREGVVAYSKTWLSLSWENKYEETIGLMVQQDWKITIPAGIDSAKEEQIHSRSTLIIQGGYDENGKWDNTKKDIQIYWREGGLIYILSSDTVGEEELIQIAESIE